MESKWARELWRCRRCWRRGGRQPLITTAEQWEESMHWACLTNHYISCALGRYDQMLPPQTN